jgi:predicted AlkP superfamily phosphohydrolase/phosphomutase
LSPDARKKKGDAGEKSLAATGEDQPGERPVAARAVVIGLDAALPSRWLRFAREGELPNLRALVERGATARRCHVPFPTITVPNWTSISTGCTPDVHRITDFHLHVPGEPLDRAWQAFDERSVCAERLWSAWARDGKASVVINYPGAWPPSVDNGLQIGGHGLDTNEWRTHATGGEYLVTLAGGDLISTAGDALALEGEWTKAEGWSDQPVGATELVCSARFRRARVPVHDERTWHLLSHKDGVRVGWGRDRSLVLADLIPGEWSEYLAATFETVEGPRDVVFRMKLLDHDHGSGLVRLYITPLCESGAGVSPPDWGHRLANLPGIPLPSAEAWEGYDLGWLDADTVIDLEEMEHERVAAIIELATASIDWTLLMLQDHGPDWFGHVLLNSLDASVEADPLKHAAAERAELRLYRSLDRLIGRIVAAAGPDTVVVVVSDHGQIPSGPWFNPRVVLEDAGLLQYTEERKAKRADGVLVEENVRLELREVDWSRTRAIAQRSVYVYVNLRGRDPDGIVEPGEEYDEICEEIIRSLLSYVDPTTGLRPVALALRRREAQVLGLPDSDDVGDVVYAVNAPYGVGHGQQLPAVECGLGSLNALFIIAGPGVKEGVEIERRVGLQDIAPTLSYLLQLPVPQDTDGAVIYQALVDGHAPFEELRALRARNARLEKVRAAYEKSVAVTHSYNQ